MPATPLPSADGALRDRHGRTAHDLRVSLTDRCNLRCSYCMPPEGLAWLPTDQMLTDAEVTRLCTLAVTHLGIHKIRFTGGEPLLRKGLESIVAACAGLRTDRGSSPELALTTNALGLAHRARALADAGLDRVNVSLDTLDREHFARITHRDRLPDVLAGIRAAQDAGLTPVKVNAVVTRAINAPDLPELFDFCLDNSLQLRVIEQMPIGPEGSWDRASMVSRAEILELLATRHQLAELSSPPTTGTLPDGALPDGMPPSTVQPEHSAPSTSAPHTAEPTVAEPTTAPPRPARTSPAVAGRRTRRHHGGHHRLGLGPLLPGLRPHATHQRRPGALLSVLHHRDRPACPAAQRGHRRPACRRLAHRHVGQATRPRPRRALVRRAVAHHEPHRRLIPVHTPGTPRP